MLKTNLSKADYISLLGLVVSILAMLLVLNNQAELSIITIIVAFVFDNLDGYVARKLNISSTYGRILDSSVDIVLYITYSFIFFNQFLSNSIFVSFIAGSLMYTFGILRLTRYNIDGIKEHKSKPYYEGITVVHILLIIICLYFISVSINWFPTVINTITVILISPLMISHVKVYKRGMALYITASLIIILAALFIYLYN